MASFQKRLQDTMKGGNLRVADLARWFGRPDPTVRQWVNYGVLPSGGAHDRDDIERQLTALEKSIKAGKHLPLAKRLSPADRIQRLTEAAGVP